MPQRSRSGHTPPPSSPAPSAGDPSSPSAPPATAGSASPQTPDSPAPTISDSPEPVSTPAATTALEAASDAKAEQHERSVVQQSPEDRKLTRDAEILDALSRGLTYRETSATFGVPISTIGMIAKRYAEFEGDIVPKLMAVKTLRALEHWEAAMETGAKAGKHAPAKDWLLQSGVVKPVQSDNGSGAKVAVIIGAPGQPVTLPNVQVITGQSLSDETQD